MSFEIFTYKSRLPVPANTAFAWHARPGAFERLNPPWDPARIVEKSGGIENGSRVTLELKMGPLPVRWVAEHSDYTPGTRFKDTQLSGPFAHWEHTHQFTDNGGNCILEDRIEYKLPFGFLGKLFGGPMIRAKLENMFGYRHRITQADLSAAQTRKADPMNILVTGANGVVGTALAPFLTSGGLNVYRMVRRKSNPANNEMEWNPETGVIDRVRIESADAVVHLAGENIAGRWSKAKKAAIRDSRIKGTRLLAETLARGLKRPKVLVSASAIGYYGDRGDVVLDESSAPGSGFLADVCKEWEDATKPAREAGIRVVNLRIGVVLTPAGGALAKMLTPFKLGAGGIMGSGKQFWSWVAIDDVIGAISHAIFTDSLRGPVNVTAPGASTNYEFTKALGKVLSRPTIFPMPAFAARLALGEMADALLLSSARVAPKRLIETGYAFRYPQLESALRHVLGK